jgi:hypothetical protein
MVSADYCRQEARPCRELAAGSSDPEAAKRWRALAADYETLAEAIDAQPPPVLRVPMQQQPVQQPQTKLADEKDEK